MVARNRLEERAVARQAYATAEGSDLRRKVARGGSRSAGTANTFAPALPNRVKLVGAKREPLERPSAGMERKAREVVEQLRLRHQKKKAQPAETAPNRKVSKTTVKR